MKRLVYPLAAALILLGCGSDGPSDTAEACAARGGQWVIKGATNIPGPVVVVGSIAIPQPGQIIYRYGCTIPRPKEADQP